VLSHPPVKLSAMRPRGDLRLDRQIDYTAVRFAAPLAIGTGQTTNTRKREGNAVECGLIVIPTAGQRDPSSVGVVKLLLSPGGNG
jgi:hypothetical protein